MYGNMTTLFLLFLSILTLLPSSTMSWSMNAPSSTCNRRVALHSFVSGSLTLLVPTVASALDMDAFMNQELEKDTKNCDPKRDPKCAPPMTKDEALCKYGQSGDARGEACKRFKESGGALNKPGAATGKSLGGAYAM